jgi:molecular chaperone DnaJ
MSKDYYKTLGVAENASKDDIKKSFRSLAKKYHPDRNNGDSSAEEKFKAVSEAYEVLSDDQKRQQYDMMRKYGGMGGGPFAGGGGGGFDPSQFKGNFRFEDIGGMSSFADLFSNIFGGEDLFGSARRGGRGGQRRKSRRRVNGNDLSIKLFINFEESINGTTRTIALKKPTTGSACGGKGEKAGTGGEVCRECGGRGTVSFAQGAFAISRPCPRCLGRGVEPGVKCDKCGGSGYFPEKKKIKIKIPSGIDNGGRIRLRGLGYPGKNGGSNGDLIVTVNVNKHQQFDREGNDIFTKVEISYPAAVLGGTIPVKTLNKTVKMKIAPGTTHGTKLRLKGMGLAVNGTKGDQIVEIQIKVPKEVTPHQKELLEELAETMK